MAYLEVNGVALEVRAAGEDPGEVGTFARAVNGDLVATRTTLKPVHACETTPLDVASARAWTGLLLGRGHSWDFADGYSGKGLAPTETGTVSFGDASGKFDKHVTIAVSGNVQWTPTGEDSLIAGDHNPKGDYTLAVWRLESAVWVHYVIRKLNGATNKWVDGGSDDGASTPWLTVSGAGVLQLSDGVAEENFSDLVALPFGVPSTWPALWAAYGRAFPRLPRLEAAGDLLGDPDTPVTVRAQRVRGEPRPTAADVLSRVIEFDMVRA